MDVSWVKDGRFVGERWTFHGWKMDVSWVKDGHFMGERWTFHGWKMDVSSLKDGRFMGERWTFHGWKMDVSSVKDGRFFCCCQINSRYVFFRRLRWPRFLRRGSARLLGLRVRVPPGTWLFLASVVCCQVEVSAAVRSLIQRNPTECGLCVCDIETSSVRRPGPTRGCCAKKILFIQKYWRIRYLCVTRGLFSNAVGLSSLR
jgi:hypothetical protein